MWFDHDLPESSASASGTGALFWWESRSDGTPTLAQPVPRSGASEDDGAVSWFGSPGGSPAQRPPAPEEPTGHGSAAQRPIEHTAAAGSQQGHGAADGAGAAAGAATTSPPTMGLWREPGTEHRGTVARSSGADGPRSDQHDDPGRPAAREHRPEHAAKPEPSSWSASERGTRTASRTDSERWTPGVERRPQSDPRPAPARDPGPVAADAARDDVGRPGADREVTPRDGSGTSRRDDARPREPLLEPAAPMRGGHRSPGPVPGEAAASRAEPSQVRRSAAALAMVVGAAGAAIGSAMPWSTMTSRDETRTFSGVVVGDGRLILVLAVLVALIAVGRLAHRPLGPGGADILAARLVSAAIIVVAVFDRIYGPPTLASFRAVSADQIAIIPEVGLTLTLGSGVVALAGAILLQAGPRSPSASRRG